VVIAAGGKGVRMGGVLPKQFLLLHGKPILQHTLERFDNIPNIDEMVLVVPASEVRRAERLVARARIRKVSHVVVGGEHRQDSVRHGLLSFDRQPTIVLVHDAVRPLVSSEVVLEVICQARRHGGAVVGVPVKDTIKIGRDGLCLRTLDRRTLWAVQTPQGFRYDVLMRAHVAAQRSGFLGTDDASLIERLHLPVVIVEGSPWNIKITTQEDLACARAWLKRG